MLTISEFTTDYFIPAGSPAPEQLRMRLDRIARNRMAEELAAGFAWVGDDDRTVIRVRHLVVDLWIDVAGMDDRQIARRWAHLAARGIARACAQSPSADVVCFEDAAHFLASFLGEALAGRAWSRWMFAEFSSLAGLPIGKIAAHLLAARPALLSPIARRLARCGQLDMLLQQFHADDVRLIMEQGLGFSSPPVTVSLTSELAATLHALRSSIVLERGPADCDFRNLLRIYVALIMHEPALAERADAQALSYHLALLHRLWSLNQQSAFWQSLFEEPFRVPDVDTAVWNRFTQEAPRAAEWLQQVVTRSSGRTYLASLMRVLAVGADGVSPASKGRAAPGKLTVDRRRLSTSFAGLALLLPCIREMRLQEAVGTDGIYQLLLSAVGHQFEPLAWGDEAVARFAGVPSRDTERARMADVPWPNAGSIGPIAATSAVPYEESPAGQSAIESLEHQARSAVATALCRRFASGLRGFAHSSPAFLASQFFNLPGVVEWSDERIDVHFNRAPLGIVLQMAGQTGMQGPIPWLDNRELNIHLGYGNRS